MKAEHSETDKRLMTIVHFNRIAMQRGEAEVWTVHNSLGCFNVIEVRMNCPMHTVYAPNGRPPRAKFKGTARLIIVNSVAYLS